jgi:hypothetical protein
VSRVFFLFALLSALTAGAADVLQGSLVSSGSSVNNLTTAVPFTLHTCGSQSCPILVYCTEDVYLYFGKDNTAAATSGNGLPWKAETFYSGTTTPSRTVLAMIPVVAGAVTCKVFAVYGDTASRRFTGGSAVPDGVLTSSDTQLVTGARNIGPHAVILQGGPGEYAIRALHDSLWDFGPSTTDYCRSVSGVVVCAGGWRWSSIEFDIAGPSTPGLDRMSFFYPRAFPLGSLRSCDSDRMGINQTLSPTGRVYHCDGSTNQRVSYSLTGSASLDFPSLGPGVKSSALTVSVTGATTSDRDVHCQAAGSLGDNLRVFESWVSAPDTVSTRLENTDDADAEDLAATTFYCTITR